MSSIISPSSVYRSLLRQYSKASIKPRTERSIHLNKALRNLVETLPPASSPSFEKKANELLNLEVFMRTQRSYSELVERYNPTHGMSTQDRTKATARRVGLDMPKWQMDE
ncbi:hypothetical protein [Phaffia rhodozyma]|uniref:Complex 1 LYR protein n=1 Tax=Phaffia rhodozyma TaxID=264483 RepID=A0A0F7SLI0_PHARH|nr:hypothetical protein [Phaffia rhodozyma]